jgi:hypothetical protein
MTDAMISGSMSLEAFNTLDYFFNGLVPEMEVDDVGGTFVWVCSYAGVKFFRRITVAEALHNEMQRRSTLN